MNSYGKYKRTGTGNGYSQANKAIYDIRSDVESCVVSQTKLSRAIRTLSADVKTIIDMLQDSVDLSRIKSECTDPLPHGDRSGKTDKVLQGSGTKDEGDGIYKDKRRRGRRMVDLHEQRQKDDGRVVGNTIAFDVSPPRGRSDIESEPE